MFYALQVDIIRSVYFPAAQCHLLIKDMIEVKSTPLLQQREKDGTALQDQDDDSFQQWLTDLCNSMKPGDNS